MTSKIDNIPSINVNIPPELQFPFFLWLKEHGRSLKYKGGFSKKTKNNSLFSAR